jgi:hypothetical protein
MRSISTIHAIIRNIILFIIVLTLSLVVWLYEGISIDKLKLYNINIDGLYLKLDKKLILKASTVTIAKSKKPLKVESIDKIFDRFRYGFQFFEFIQLKKIDFKNNHYYLTYVNGVLHIVSDEYESVVDIKREGQKLKADISLLYIKKEDITLWGKLSYNMRSGDIDAKGVYRAYNLDGNFEFEKIGSKIALKLDTNETHSIATIIKRFIKKPKTQEWILKRVVAKSYRIDELKAQGEIRRGVFKLDMDSIYGRAYAKDVNIDFKKDLNKSGYAKTIKLIYQKGDLHFFPTNLRYHDKNISKGKVVIDNLDKKVQNLHINLNLISRFDKDIQEILTAYKLKVPIAQINGETNASFYLGVNLATHKVKFLGEFNLTKGVVKIANAPISINRAQISYAKKMVNIKNAQLESDLYKAKVTGEVNLKEHKALLNVDLDRFSVLKKRKKIIYATGLTLPVSLDYTKGVKFNIPKLKSKIYTQNSNIVMEFKDINKVKEYVKVLPPDLDGGELKLKTQKFQTFRLSGYAKWKECFLYSKKGVCHSRLPFSGRIKKGHLKLNIFKNKIKLFTYNDTIYVNGMHIDLDKLLREKSKKIHKYGKTSKHEPKHITILGKNSTIRYKKYHLITPHYTVDMRPKSVVFKSMEGNRKLYFKKQGNQISIDAQNIDDRMLHPLINFKALKGGRYSLFLDGDFEKRMEGKIVIDGGIVEQFQAYNNLVAFFNAIPALVTFSNPGFNNKGYKIKKGEIEYSLINQNIIKFKSIKIVGGSSTIVGAGTINIAKNSVNLDLAIQTAREIGKVVGSIPIVGYILMGDGKSIAMGVKVRGTLSNPKVESQPVQDMVSLPLGMIDRLFKSPKRLLEGNKKANSNR